MKIELKQPDPEFPLVWVYAYSDYRTKDAEGISQDLYLVLKGRRITLLAQWELHEVKGTIVIIKAPALLEDEHVKLPKRRSKK